MGVKDTNPAIYLAFTNSDSLCVNSLNSGLLTGRRNFLLKLVCQKWNFAQVNNISKSPHNLQKCAGIQAAQMLFFHEMLESQFLSGSRSMHASLRISLCVMLGFLFSGSTSSWSEWWTYEGISGESLFSCLKCTMSPVVF